MVRLGGVRRRVRAAIARVVPATAGGRLGAISRGWNRSRATELVRDDPARALLLLEPELAVGNPDTETVMVAFKAASRLGDNIRSAELGARLLSTGRPRIALQIRRTALKTDMSDLAREATAVLVASTPAYQEVLDDTAEVMRLQPPILAEEMIARVEQTARGLDLTKLQDAADEGRVAAAPADEVRYVAEQLLRSRAAAGTAVIRGLSRVNNWPVLSDLMAQEPKDAWLDLAPKHARQIATRAAAAGWDDIALTVADAALSQDPTSEALQRLAGDARDVLDITTAGWSYPERAVSTQNASRTIVSVLGQSLPIRSGGYATRSHGLLTSLRANGWDVQAVTKWGFPYDLWWDADDDRTVAERDVVDGVPYHRIIEPGRTDYPRLPLATSVAGTAAGVESLARTHRAALIHASSLYDVGMAGLTAARRLGVPFVYEMRGLKQLLEEAHHPEFGMSPRRRYLDVLEASVAREADAVLVITRALGEEMVRLGVQPDRITVVPNGVHMAQFEPRTRDEELEARLELAGRTVIGYAGGFVRYEGLDDLLIATEQIVSAGRDDFRLLLVGDGASYARIRRLSHDLGLDDHVIFTGRVEHHQVSRYLSLIDIAPFPRKPLPVCELISPIKPFEAMAMAKAVVVSDVAALTEIVTDGVTGRSFSKGDPGSLASVLAELLDDETQRARLGEGARRWAAERHDWSQVTLAVDAVYRRLLSTG